jgi:hypothetical protein
VKGRILSALCVAVGIGLTLRMPEVQMHFADPEQRLPLLDLEQWNDWQRPFADEILKVSSMGDKTGNRFRGLGFYWGFKQVAGRPGLEPG